MRIALANYGFKNNDIEFNLAQIERGLSAVSSKTGHEASAGSTADLLCFGEAFLQGFDSLTWDYGTDRTVAVAQDSEVMRRICSLSAKYDVDLVVGYIELAGDAIYSSCAVIVNATLVHNYRRISRGWKEYTRTDGHYREGDSVDAFEYKGHRITLALCGDMWDYPERFKTDDLLIWPVYVNLPLQKWQQEEEADYIKQAQLASDNTLMIDSLCRETDPDGAAAAFYFRNGQIAAQTKYGVEDIVIIDY